MADPSVKLIITANSTEAERAIATLERKYNSLEQNIKRLNQTTKQSGETSKGLELGLDGALTKLTGMITAGRVFETVLGNIVDKAGQANSKMAEMLQGQRMAEAKLQVQGGLTPKATKEAIENLLPELQRTPAATLTQMTEMQVAAQESGFDEADTKSGAITNELLKLRAASGQFGKGMEDPVESVEAVSGLMTGLGSGKKASDVRRLGSKVAAIMGETNVKFSDLKQFSQVGGALTAMGLDESQSLASMSVTSEAGGSMVGSTAMKNIALRLGTAGADKERAGLLKSMNLTPDDVALAKGGVTLEQAGDKLRNALKDKTEVEKNQFMGRFFGAEAVAGASVLFGDEGWGKYKNRLNLVENAPAEMERRLESYQLSREAVVQRSARKQEVALWNKAQKGEQWAEYELRKDADWTADREADGTWGGRMRHDIGRGIMDTFDSIDKTLGFDPGQHIASGAIGLTHNDRIEGSDWSEVARKQLEAINNQTEVLRGIANDIKQQPIDRNAQRE